MGDTRPKYVSEAMDAARSFKKPLPKDGPISVLQRFNLLQGTPLPVKTNAFDYWNPTTVKQRQSRNYTELPPSGTFYNPINGRIQAARPSLSSFS
jgi:hypothetical protein